jgi:hypothetical protein
MRTAAKKAPSDLFDSILVHFGSDKARFHPTHLKIDRSFITVPTAWHFKPMTEVKIKIQVPSKSGNEKLIQCHAIILDCRPLKPKGHYEVDLFIIDLPQRHTGTLEKLQAHSKSYSKPRPESQSPNGRVERQHARQELR